VPPRTAIREHVLGPHHSEVADSLNNLAEIERATGRFVAAEPLYRRALVILEAKFGNNHQSISTVMNNLAALYAQLRYYERAIPLYRSSLAIIEQSPGPHSHVAATIWNNLAVTYLAQRKYRQAEDSLRHSLAFEESADVLATYAQICRNTRRKRQAMQIDSRVAELRAAGNKGELLLGQSSLTTDIWQSHEEKH